MEYIKAINKLIFPSYNMCYFCREREEDIEKFICNDCREQLELVDRKIELESSDIEYVCYSLVYNKRIREVVKEYKFHKKSYLYKPLGNLMLDTAKTYNLRDEVDLIIYIPIHRRKEAIRGYNQCELIADLLAKELQINISHNNFYKKKNTKSQNKLDRLSRMENLKDSFDLKNPHEIENKRILLIDDIITTGSTMIESGRLLKRAGAKKVIGLALTSSKKI